MIGDTVDGDQLVTDSSNPERIFVLPWNSENIYVARNGLLVASAWLCSSGTLTVRKPGQVGAAKVGNSSNRGLVARGATSCVSCDLSSTVIPLAVFHVPQISVIALHRNATFFL